MTSVRQLFGGAITCAVPADYKDASTIRQIPDNQEVFVDLKGDNSFIVELLQMEDAPDHQAAEHHFNQLASDNESTIQSVTPSTQIPPKELLYLNQPGVLASFLVGVQQVSKFNEKASNSVQVFMAVIRLKKVTTDILVTFNRAAEISAASSSAGSPVASSEEALTMFTTAVKSFRIVDWSLFKED